MPNKQWHPLFVTSLREALSDARPGQVEIIPEVALSSKPLDVDVLVVKKSKAAHLQHPLADIFRTYNLFEFKSPDDYLEPNDFDKGMAIARLYKVIEHEKMHNLDQITVTFVSRRHPRAMLEMIRSRGLLVHNSKPVPGLYRVKGEVMPVQVMVLKELSGPEVSYMFAAFLTGKEKLRLDATSLLIKKHLDDPVNPHRRELLEFKFKNQLVTPEEMEVVMEMLGQMTEKDRARIEEILRNHPASQEMADRIRAEKAQDVIRKFLARRFGSKSSGLQQKVQQMTNLEVLDYVLEELFAINTMEEAQAIINDGTGKSLQ